MLHGKKDFAHVIDVSGNKIERLTWVIWAKVLITQLCLTLVIPWTVAHQAPLSMVFPRQEYWSGLPFPSPGNFPNLGIEPRSATLQADSLLSEPPGSLYEWAQSNPMNPIKAEDFLWLGSENRSWRRNQRGSKCEKDSSQGCWKGPT